MSDLQITPVKWIGTNEGYMVPIFKDYEWDHHDVKMVYVSTIKQGESKGPIVHSKRSSIVTAVSGWVVAEIFVGDQIETVTLHCPSVKGNFLRRPRERVCNAVMITPGMAVRYKSSSGQGEGMLVSLPNVAWSPNNDDSIKYSDWNDYHRKIKA